MKTFVNKAWGTIEEPCFNFDGIHTALSGLKIRVYFCVCSQIYTLWDPKEWKWSANQILGKNNEKISPAALQILFFFLIFSLCKHFPNLAASQQGRGPF